MDLQPTQTLGQQLVGVRFNPSGLTEVDKVKQQFADWIDDAIEAQYLKPHTSIIAQHAIKDLTTACMQYVKFLTNK